MYSLQYCKFSNEFIDKPFALIKFVITLDHNSDVYDLSPKVITYKVINYHARVIRGYLKMCG